MSETASCQYDWQVLIGVATGITEVTAKVDHRAIKQGRLVFLRLFEACYKLAEHFHTFRFNEAQLSQLSWILAVMREVVVTKCDPIDGWGARVARQHDGDQSRRIRSDGEMREAE